MTIIISTDIIFLVFKRRSCWLRFRRVKEVEFIGGWSNLEKESVHRKSMNNSCGQLISMLDKSWWNSSPQGYNSAKRIAVGGGITVPQQPLRRLKRIISTVVDRQRGRIRVERSGRPLNPELNEFDEEGNNFFSTTLKITSEEFVLIIIPAPPPLSSLPRNSNNRFFARNSTQDLTTVSSKLTRYPRVFAPNWNENNGHAMKNGSFSLGSLAARQTFYN